MDLFPHWLTAAVAGIFIVLAAGGIWFYRQQQSRLRLDAEQTLLSIARLKTQEIVHWKSERLGDASAVAENPLLVDAAVQWMRSPNRQVEQKIRAHFQSIKNQYAYQDVWLADPEGRILLSGLDGDRPALQKTELRVLQESLDLPHSVMTDMIHGGSEAPARIYFMASLISREDESAVPIGAIVLVCDVGHYLYPLIQQWPTPSQTAESLLIRRDGDAALFLNDLRHLPDAAFRLRIPLSSTETPAIKAALGATGIVEGLDYRGERVLSAIYPVAGTPWYLVAKIDKSEVLESAHYRGMIIIGITLSLFLAAAAMAWAYFQNRAKTDYRLRLEVEKARRETEERNGIILMSIGDGVIVTDPKGNVTLLNPIAESLTGWKQAEAFGKAIDTVFDICNEHTREKVPNPVLQVIQNGCIVGLANHTLLRSRTGKECPIMDSSAPVRDADGALAGTVLVFRDQTAERTAQRLLQEEHSILKSVMLASPVGLIVFDDSGCMVNANPAAERLFERKLDTSDDMMRCGELLGCRYHSRHPAGCGFSDLCATCSLNNAIRAAVQKHEGIHGGECTVDRLVDGRQEPCILTFSVEPVQINDRWHAVAAMSDITQRRQMEIQLMRNSALLNEMGNAAGIGAWELDVETMAGKWTDQMYRIFELPPGRKPPLENAIGFYHPDDQDQFRDSIRNALQRGEGFDLELRLITARGRMIWVRSLCKTESKDGTTKRLIGTLQDINDKKLASLELQKKTEEVERYFSTALDLFCIADKEGHFRRLNQQWEDFLGYPLEELLGRRFMDFVHPEDVAATQQSLNRNEGRPILNFVNRYRRRDGSYRWLEWRGYPSGDAIFGAARDITDRIMAEQQRDRLALQLQQAMKMEAVGRLAGGVAHDFNNLLTGIQGYTDLILSGLNPRDPLRVDLLEVQKAARSAADLTRQLLAFSRKQLIEPKVLNLNDLIGSLNRMLKRLIGEDIELTTVLQEDLASVKLDSGQYEQILVNLAVNARDAMPDGGKLVIETANVTLDEAYCTVHPYVKPGPCVMLAISDTGCGMSGEVKEHLFEPFFTTKPKGRGTGLGLATIYGAVKQSGGSIEVYSEEGRGTVFKIYLPSVAEAAEPLKRQETASPDTPGGEETILLVEDEPIVRELAVKILKRLRYKVLQAADGDAALKAARQYDKSIHLLITDVVMPGMNGRQLAEKMIQEFPGVKVLFTSGYTENAIAHHGILEKDVNFLGKPYSVGDLANKIRSLLG